MQRNACLKAALPAFQSIGAPPEKHADRVVAEMLRVIVMARGRVFEKIQQVLRDTPDGNPRAQAKLVQKLEAAGHPFVLGVHIQPGKRGRYNLFFALIEGWDADRKDLILPKDDIPEKPWLACSHVKITSKGRSVYECDIQLSLFITHHALSRLAQRFCVKHPRDFIACVSNAWTAYQTENVAREGHFLVRDGQRLRFHPREGLSACAVLNKYNDGEGGAVVATIVPCSDEDADEAA
jgi:hypothetical protein